MKLSALKIVCFIAILSGIYLFIGLFKTLPLCPQGVHQWAQCDRASVALNFGVDTYNFFKPRVHNTNNGSGISGMEFPIINYISGMLYRLFGHLNFIYRLVMLIIMTLGLIAGFMLSYDYLRNFYLSFFAIIFMFLSPILIFYTPNYLPDTASLGFLLISWMFYLKYLHTQKYKYMVLIFIAGALASLIKITALISIITMILILCIHLFLPGFFKISQIPKGKSYRLLLALFLTITVTAAWYMYAKWLSAEHNSGLFLLNTRITFSIDKILEYLDFIYKHWWDQYYSRLSYYLIILSVLIIFFFNKYTDRLLATVTFFIWTGNILFAFIMLAQYQHHDYYVIGLLPAVFFLVLTAIVTLKNYIGTGQQQVYNVLYTVTLLILVNSLLFCKNNYEERYHPASWMKSPEVFRKYYEIQPYVESLGMERNKRTISAFDWSPNVTLYLMDLKGMCISPDFGHEGILNELKKGGDYLVLNDTTVFSNQEIVSFLNNKIGEKDGLFFYKLGSTQ